MGEGRQRIQAGQVAGRGGEGPRQSVGFQVPGVPGRAKDMPGKRDGVHSDEVRGRIGAAAVPPPAGEHSGARVSASADVTHGGRTARKSGE